jgi:hypothetical protein
MTEPRREAQLKFTPLPLHTATTYICNNTGKETESTQPHQGTTGPVRNIMSTISADMERPQTTPPVKREPMDPAFTTPHSSDAERPHSAPIDNAALQNMFAAARQVNLGRSMLKRPRRHNNRDPTSNSHNSMGEPHENSPKRARYNEARSPGHSPYTRHKA